MDDQLMRHNGMNGTYFAADHSVRPSGGSTRPFPHSHTDTHLLLGEPYDSQIAVPLVANIYDELADITTVLRSLQ